MRGLPLEASPLQLEGYYVQALRFELQDEFDRETATRFPAPDDLEWNIEDATTPDGVLAVRLTLQLAPDNPRFAYAFKIILIGLFRVDETYEGDAQQLADANAPAVLFGAAREAIAAATGRGPFPGLCLPSVHFVNFERANGNTQPTQVTDISPPTEP